MRRDGRALVESPRESKRREEQGRGACFGVEENDGRADADGRVDDADGSKRGMKKRREGMQGKKKF